MLPITAMLAVAIVVVFLADGFRRGKKQGNAWGCSLFSGADFEEQQALDISQMLC